MNHTRASEWKWTSSCWKERIPLMGAQPGFPWSPEGWWGSEMPLDQWGDLCWRKHDSPHAGFLLSFWAHHKFRTVVESVGSGTIPHWFGFWFHRDKPCDLGQSTWLLCVSVFPPTHKMGMVPASQFAMKIEIIPYKVLDRYLALDIILLMLAVAMMVMMTQVMRSLFLPKPSPFLAQLLSLLWISMVFTLLYTI